MQYKIIPLKHGDREIQEQLDNMAKDGWILVTVVDQPTVFKGSTGQQSTLSSYVAYFKKD